MSLAHFELTCLYSVALVLSTASTFGLLLLYIVCLFSHRHTGNQALLWFLHTCRYAHIYPNSSSINHPWDTKLYESFSNILYQTTSNQILDISNFQFFWPRDISLLFVSTTNYLLNGSFPPLSPSLSLSPCSFTRSSQESIYKFLFFSCGSASLPHLFT